MCVGVSVCTLEPSYLLFRERVDVLLVGAKEHVSEDGAAVTDRHVLVQQGRPIGTHRIHQDL